MALSTHVTDRYGTASPFLRNLTNHDDPDASSVNTTRLSLAASAASGQFPVHAQVEYDDTDQSHIEAGVIGVIAYLKQWSTGDAEPPEMGRFHKALESIAKISSRKRIIPVAAERPEPDEDLFAGVSPEWPATTEDL